MNKKRIFIFCCSAFLLYFVIYVLFFFLSIEYYETPELAFSNGDKGEVFYIIQGEESARALTNRSDIEKEHFSLKKNEKGWYFAIAFQRNQIFRKVYYNEPNFYSVEIVNCRGTKDYFVEVIIMGGYAVQISDNVESNFDFKEEPTDTGESYIWYFAYVKNLNEEEYEITVNGVTHRID